MVPKIIEKKYLPLFLLFFCCSLASSAQKWEKLYTPNIWFYCTSESYDGGYYLAGSVLYKTDENGNTLWKREWGNMNVYPAANAIIGTHDGGVILAGWSLGVDSFNAATLLKLNACGEKEWGKIYDLNENLGGSAQMALLKNGDILVSCYMANYDNSLGDWMFRTDSMGNLKDQSFNAVEVGNQSMVMDKDSNVITTGGVYLPIPGDPNELILTGAIAKTDINGHLDWVSAHSNNVPFFDQATQLAPDGGYLTLAGYNIINGDKDNLALMFIKSDTSGHTEWTKLIGDTTRYENPINMFRINDSLYMVTAYSLNKYGLNSHDSEYVKFMILDFNGKVYKTGGYSAGNWQTIVYSIHPTPDGKYILNGTMNDSNPNGSPSYSQVYVVRINQNLELDTINPNDTLKYDYLCGNKIVPDSVINYDGDTIPIHEPGLTGFAMYKATPKSFSLYPNPATNQVTLTASGLGFGAAICTVYDILGNKVKVYTQCPVSGHLVEQINLSGYTKGVYYVKLVQGDKRYVQKLVVE